METRDHSYPGEFGQNTGEQDVEGRFGEEAYAYERRRSQTERQAQQGGMAVSSAMDGIGTPAGQESAYGSAIEGTRQASGIDSADHGPEGTVNSGSGTGLSSGNATGGATTGDDAHTTMPPKRQG
jgi:hypothetical protein